MVENGATGSSRNGSGTGPFIEEAIRFAGTLSARRVSGAEQLNMLAQSARGLGETFDDLPAVRDQLDQAAEMMDEWAEYIRSTDVRDMASDARRVVTDHPYATFAVAIAVGLAAGSYVKRRARAESLARGAGSGRRARGKVRAQRPQGQRGGMARRDDVARADAG
jgi:ElaB/YqjD/DUF883 family membrane-anchored ribosome-binding protein